MNKNFPGCIGYLDCVKITSQREDSPIGKGETENIMEMNVECWMDMDKYCWAYYSLPNVGNGDVKLLKSSPLLREIFRTDLTLYHEKGYRIKDTGTIRHLMYFIVEGKYPKWPIFIEKKEDDERSAVRIFNQSHDTARNVVKEFFLEMKRKYSILYDSVGCEEVKVCDMISKACIILHNVMNRFDFLSNGAEERSGEQVMKELFTTGQRNMEQSLHDTEMFEREAEMKWYETVCNGVEDRDMSRSHL